MMKTNVKKNFVLTLSYNLLNILIPFVSTPYIARVLGAEKIGVFSYSYSVASYFVIFIMLGLNNYGNRTIAGVRDDRNKLTKTFWDIYYMQSVLSVLAIMIYLIYVGMAADDKLIAGILGLYVISAGFDITWFFFGIEDFQFAVIRNLVIKVLDLICIFLWVKTVNDLWLYTVIISLGFLCSQLFLWSKIRKYVDVSRPNLKDSIQHLKPNIVLFIPVIAISVYNMMDKIMLGNICSKSQVGYYDNAEKIINIPQVAVTSLGTAMLPRITNMMIKGNEEGTIAYLRKSIVFSSAISSACTFGIVSVAPEFVSVFLGKGYEECITLIYCLMPMLIFKAFANVMRTQYLIPRKKDKVFVTSVCAGAIINFLLNLIFIPKIQAVGACIATVCAEASVCIYQMYHVMKEQQLGENILQAIFFQVIGIIMYIVLQNVNIDGNDWIVLSKKIILGGMVYLILSVGFCYIERKKLFS